MTIRAQTAVNYLAQFPPDLDSDLNTCYWYNATLALFHYRGSEWERRNETLTGGLLAHQRSCGLAVESWAPEGEWTPIGEYIRRGGVR